MLSVRYHNARGEVILAACDAELLGKLFVEGERRIEVYRSFYGGELVQEDAFGAHLERATIANLVGNRAVGIAVDMGYVSRARILMIDHVPHAQFALISRD